MKIYIHEKFVLVGKKTPQKKPKFSQDPSEYFVNFLKEN